MNYLGIEHIGCFVSDLEDAKTFFTTYFKGQANSGYHNPKTTLKTYFITFDHGPRLELMTRKDVEFSQSQSLMGIEHLAFQLESNQDVDRMTLKLKTAGYAVLSEPRTTGDNYYESVILYDQIKIELVAKTELTM